MYWYEKETRRFSGVLSCRVRFARNLEDTPFPHRLSPSQASALFQRVKEALQEEKVLAVDFDGLDETVKKAYVETHLASEELSRKGKGSGLILSDDGDVSIMVNEEDHIRLQVFSSGKEVEK